MATYFIALFHGCRKCIKNVAKISFDHIKLTPYSVMRVNLAAQVLSTTVANVLLHYGGDNSSATANYCKMVDGFFDCKNVRSGDEYIRKRKPKLAPYTNLNDPSFDWLKTEFLSYLRLWKCSTEQRIGNFTQNARSKMFLSWQTFVGFEVTTYSVIEVVKFLLSEGMAFVLTERFCQDPIEEYFGNQRQLGRRCDNPDLKTFVYNDNAIRIQKSISCQSGNTRGRYDKRKNWENVTADKLPKGKSNLKKGKI